MGFYESEKPGARARLVLSSKEAKVEERKRERGKGSEARGIWNVIKKKKLNYYTILIDANDVRIIMIIVVILTIGNSPILYD